MPYRPSDATRFTRKANSSKKRRQWSYVYASAIKRGASEGSAIAQASGVVKQSSGSKERRAKNMARRKGRKGKGRKRGRK